MGNTLDMINIPPSYTMAAQNPNLWFWSSWNLSM